MATEMKKKFLDMKAVDGPDDRTFRAIITTPAVDRVGDVLLPEGMIATDFEANPVVFYVHKYETHPIARCIELKRKAESWEAVARLADRPENHEGEWVPDVVYSLIKQGILNGVSVGFLPVETRKPTVKDQKKFGPDVANVISKWKLLEYSVTGMPCNQEALITAVKSYSPETQKKLVGAAAKSSPAPLVVIDDIGDGEEKAGKQEPDPVRECSPRKVVLMIETGRKHTEAQKRAALKKGKLWL